MEKIVVLGHDDEAGWTEWFSALFGCFPNLGLVTTGGDTGPSAGALVAAGTSDIMTRGFMCKGATRRGPGGETEGAVELAKEYCLIPLATEDFDVRDYAIILASLGLTM
jgi:hypothetical protein